MSKHPSRQALFDQWASTYNHQLEENDLFPFIGYDAVLNMMVEKAHLQPLDVVLDLGIGTGNLAKRLEHPDVQIWGVDFSQAMLDQAHAALPDAHLVLADLGKCDWVDAVNHHFDCILSAYTLHEFRDDEKVRLLSRLANMCLNTGGRIVIGDISFKSRRDFEHGYVQFTDLWDQAEYYWCAEEMMPALNQAGLSVDYFQVSVCAGVYLVQPQHSGTPGR